MCCSRIFMRLAGMRHSALSNSISDHCALRNSPGRTNTNGASRSAHFVAKNPSIRINGPQQLRQRASVR